MKKLSPSLVLLFTITTVVFAQKEANHWVIGEYAGLDFNPGEPVVFSSQVNTRFSPVSISDRTTGELLFYSDGLTLWNRDHEVMLNGNDINGSAPRFFQHCIAVPLPSDPSRYYLFTLAASTGEQLYHRLFYSVIDMSLDNGRGGVVEPLKNVDADMTLLAAKITAIPHANDKDYWLVTHSAVGNEFYVNLVTEAGIQQPDTVATGSSYEVRPPRERVTGYIKASPNGQKIAVSHFFTRPPAPYTDPVEDGWPFEVFDFDPATGKITSPVYLGHFIYQAGISFSPDNSKLYLLGIDDKDVFHQFDINAENMIASKTELFLQNPGLQGKVGLGILGEAMEIAINGKIYLGGGNYSFQEVNVLLVIHDPNAKGFDSDIDSVSFPLQPFQKFSFGLPNSIQSTFDNITPNRNPNVPCSDHTLYSLYPNPASGFITIKMPERCFAPYTLSIYNSLGQALSRYFMNRPGDIPVRIHNLSPGLYFVVLDLPSQRVVQRFIKI